jgi:pimeloyl-ACP methyl ester carboxylesterase
MPDSKSVNIEGGPVSYVFSENGGPTVVFDAGGGGTLNDWRRVYNDVAEYTSVVAYTRSTRAKAGDKITGKDAAFTLKTLLEEIKAPKPYVLVGHSLGGMYVRCFAKFYPEDVSGVVLVDSVPKGFRKEAVRLGKDFFPASLDGIPAHLQAELRGWEETDEQLPTSAEWGQMPITRIVADKVAAGYEKLQPSWLRFQKEFIEGLPNGRLVEAHGSGHYVQFDAPEIVLREIRLMVDKTVAE